MENQTSRLRLHDTSLLFLLLLLVHTMPADQASALLRLNLTSNDFCGASLPPSGFERLVELTHLNLSNNSFAGQVPVGIGNLIKLVSLIKLV
ncbi:receptor-like protein 35 [Phragmites australis]|uniref:receptor-like protein 35 n=1 Tax=Phragmites australis TaxID=29695 RepID=UPI002D7706F7|nr:receptor-like protein 35 [Phragmites australis]